MGGLAVPAAAVETPTHAVTETATKTRMHKAGPSGGVRHVGPQLQGVANLARNLKFESISLQQRVERTTIA